MKQLISVLVAAMFAAVSVAAMAQGKADADKGTKTKTSQTKKADKGDKMAKPAKKAPKKTAKKMEGEGKKK